MPKEKNEKERDPLLFEARALAVFHVIEIEYRNMNWRKVKIGNIVVLLREDFHYFSLGICCVIGQRFQDGKISRFTFTIVSNLFERTL